MECLAQASSWTEGGADYNLVVTGHWGLSDLTKDTLTMTDKVMPFYVQKVRGQIHCGITMISKKTVSWGYLVLQPKNVHYSC